ncbi:hypothetical protein L6452_08269 [Arctium lappa]|uniref:Uncharacterized protein n=1 Tax=Arctium lappa TaxID=4217 RepID=A0ACB9DHA3_ARCLA|nr:hypothetical protein L6452_08269 [Arctium lappa]
MYWRPSVSHVNGLSLHRGRRAKNDEGSESEGDDQPDHDTGPPSHAGVGRAHEATLVEESPFHAGHSPSFHREHSPAGHYQHSPHVDPYADRWAEFTRWKDDFYDYRTSHRTEHDDLERRLTEKWATEHSEREATERRLAELERLTSQFSSFQIPGQQQGGQPSQPANTQHGFGSLIFGGPSQYTDNSSSSFLDEIFGPSSFVTPTHHMAHGIGGHHSRSLAVSALSSIHRASICSLAHLGRCSMRPDRLRWVQTAAAATATAATATAATAAATTSAYLLVLSVQE